MGVLQTDLAEHKAGLQAVREQLNGQQVVVLGYAVVAHYCSPFYNKGEETEKKKHRKKKEISKIEFQMESLEVMCYVIIVKST